MYLVIQNDGLIEKEDLTLIGSSTKRNSADKIGMFGSGWKYALAWLTRNMIEFNIYRGNDEIKIDFKQVKHRDRTVGVITVDDKETSMTTEMGPKWTGWMALREIISNAIDEPNHSINSMFSIPENLPEDKTTIVLKTNNELNKVVRNYNHYFAFERTPTFTTENGDQIFVNSTKDKQNIYRKGIRCYDSEYEKYCDFSFDNIDINESRLASASDIRNSILKISRQKLPYKVFKHILLDEVFSSYYKDTMKENFVKMYSEGYRFITPNMSGFSMLLFGADVPEDKLITISSSMMDSLLKYNIIESPFSNNEIQFKETLKRFPTEVHRILACNNITGVTVQFGVLAESYSNFVRNDSNTFFAFKDDVPYTDEEVAIIVIQNMKVKDLVGNLLEY